MLDGLELIAAPSGRFFVRVMDLDLVQEAVGEPSDGVWHIDREFLNLTQIDGITYYIGDRATLIEEALTESAALQDEDGPVAIYTDGTYVIAEFELDDESVTGVPAALRNFSS